MAWILISLCVATIVALFTVGRKKSAVAVQIPRVIVTNSIMESNKTNMETPAQKVYDAAKNNMGRHLTLDPSVPEEVGCCEALSLTLLDAGYSVPSKGIAAVNSMIAWMIAKGFTETDTPIPGTVITAHSPDYYNPNGAHVGVVMEYGICSNTSANGLWQENYASVQAWRDGFPLSTTRFFIPS